MAKSYDELNKSLIDAGLSRTIYSLVMPETRSAVDSVIDGGRRKELLAGGLSEYFKTHSGAVDVAALSSFLDAALGKARRGGFHTLYDDAWTQKQDAMHEIFFETWKQWSGPIVKADWGKFPFMYPTAGASEGLREAINEYGARARVNGFQPAIHLFTGEYEGYEAYAGAAGIPVVKHDRAQWRDALEKIGPNDQFYLSQPSAMDGDVWPDYDAFAQALFEAQPAAQLMLDVTYVGSVAKDFEIKADYPNIPAVFFSLSKPFGTYYFRIGGCMTRDKLSAMPTAPGIDDKPADAGRMVELYPGLYGNKWFKSLMALRLGTELMRQNDVYALPRKYAPVQSQAVQKANLSMGFNLTASDVVLLGTMKLPENPREIERHLARGSASEAKVRACLTPTMARILGSRFAYEEPTPLGDKI